jgi:hypothetical protein
MIHTIRYFGHIDTSLRELVPGTNQPLRSSLRLLVDSHGRDAEFGVVRSS